MFHYPQTANIAIKKLAMETGQLGKTSQLWLIGLETFMKYILQMRNENTSFTYMGYHDHSTSSENGVLRLAGEGDEIFFVTR